MPRDLEVVNVPVPVVPDLVDGGHNRDYSVVPSYAPRGRT
jgi:hypothetical protein